ncbi:hypothetical protein [Pseudaestuariivita rosea]|uniref:hypothetical protein n=1 Tax=Pseudaestuariivita rosea TaxID=2763263 RepID=UPI001ABB80CF|nr:hypothetical protein [Pseudaestuariivita rosea]
MDASKTSLGNCLAVIVAIPRHRTPRKAFSCNISMCFGAKVGKLPYVSCLPPHCHILSASIFSLLDKSEEIVNKVTVDHFIYDLWCSGLVIGVFGDKQGHPT